MIHLVSQIQKSIVLLYKNLHLTLSGLKHFVQNEFSTHDKTLNSPHFLPANVTQIEVHRISANMQLDSTFHTPQHTLQFIDIRFIANCIYEIS